MKLYDIDRQCIVASHLEVAEDVRSRTRGLIGHRPLRMGEAMLISPCRWIHTFRMSFPIDVVYVDRNWHIIAFTENLAPNRIDRPVLRAYAVIEMMAGAIHNLGLAVGDQLRLQPDS